jgi:ribose-phosphate pyrophosphokinase
MLDSMVKPIKIFAGRSNPALAEKIAHYLNTPLCNAKVENFSDGEISVNYNESVRGSDLFIIQSTNPPGDNLMELLIMIDAARRSSAARITAVMPYYGYARQDRKDRPRVAITAKLVANLLTEAGANRILTMDLHAAQIQGFFDIPFDHLYSSVVLINDIRHRDFRDNLVVASPDVGGVKLARKFAEELGTDLVIVDKRRPRANVAEVMNIIGDVRGKNVLLVDDMIDTAGTLVNAAKAIRDAGGLKVYAAATHPILSGPAIERINNSVLEKLIVTDSLITTHDYSPKIDTVSVSQLFGEAIKRIYEDDSVSCLFDSKNIYEKLSNIH